VCFVALVLQPSTRKVSFGLFLIFGSLAAKGTAFLRFKKLRVANANETGVIMGMIHHVVVLLQPLIFQIADCTGDWVFLANHY
jgi:hypothetical protein